MSTRLPMRRLISEMMARCSDQFIAVPEFRPGYWFRRDASELFHDFVLIQSSQRCFSVDVAVTAFPKWDGAYGQHQMQAATGLPNLRLGSSAIPAEVATYSYDGTLQEAEATLARISQKLRSHAVPWFDDFRRKAAEDKLLQFGLRWVDEHRLEIPNDIATQFETDGPAHAWYSGGRRSRVEHPVLRSLKDALRCHAVHVDATKWQRQEITLLALHLLALAGQGLLPRVKGEEPF